MCQKCRVKIGQCGAKPDEVTAFVLRRIGLCLGGKVGGGAEAVDFIDELEEVEALVFILLDECQEGVQSLGNK